MKIIPIALALFLLAGHQRVTFYSQNTPHGAPPGGAPSVDFISTTLGSGGSNITTWADSSGNSNTATWTTNFPTVDTTNTTPNSTKTANFGASTDEGDLATGLTNSTSTTVCAVYNTHDVTTTFPTLSGDSAGSSVSYLTNNTSATPQLFYNASTGIIAQATNTPLANTWTTSCGVLTNGVSATFYLWNGTSSGVDPTATFNSVSISNGINQVFGTSTLAAYNGNIARLTIWNRALTSTEISTYHVAQQTLFGVS